MFYFDFTEQIQSFLNQFWYQINFLLLIILVVLGYLSYKKPIYAVGLTIILLPTYLFRSQIWFLPFTYLEICIWIVFVGLLINKIKNKDYKLQATSYKLRWPILVILLASTISMVIAPNLTAAAGLWKAYFIEPILFFLIIASVLKTDEDKKTILWALGISTLSISLLAIYQKFTGFGIAEASWLAPEHRRVTAMFTSPNAVGLYLAPIILIYLGWLMSRITYHVSRIKESRNQTCTNIFIIGIIILNLLAILFTVSQGTWIGLVAGTIFLAFWGWSKKWTAGIVLIVIVLTLLIPVARDKIWPIATLQDPSGQNRLILWDMAGENLLSNPKNFILGTGIFGFSEIQNQAREPLKMEALLYPHNILLNFWTEIGLLGLIAFGWVVILFFKNGLKSYSLQPAARSLVTLGIIAAMVCLIVHGLIDVPYFKNDLAILFWVIIGLL